MAVETHELKERLMASITSIAQLSTRHHELDERLHDFSSRHFLTEPEQSKSRKSRNRSSASRTGCETSSAAGRCP